MIKKLFFLLLIFILSAKFSEAGQFEDSLKIVNNPLRSIDDRKKAVEGIKSNEDARTLSTLSEIVRNKTESIIFRSYIVDVLTQSKNEWSTIELTKVTKDMTLPSEVRKPALYGLWMKNPQQFKPEVMKIAQNSSEPVDLRVTALTYLRTSGDPNLPLSFWKNLLTKNNDTHIRIAALNGMEQFGFLTQEKNSLLQIIQNPSEDIRIRKTGILNAERALASEEVASELLKIISRTDNSLEIRKFALDHLMSDSLTDLIPQLERIAATEKNPAFKNDLKSQIETMKS